MASTCLCLSTAPIFSGDNYDFWATKMQHFLKASDLWDLVDKGFETPVANEQLTEEQQKISKENLFKKNEKALYILKSTVSDKILPHIMGDITAKEAWTILQQKNQDTKKKEKIDWMESMRAMQYHSGEKSNIANKFTVPEKLRKENENSYKPKVVSIGPRFRGSRDLLKMEKTKWECMSSLLDIVQGNAESNLAKCGELILGSEKEVRASYADDLKQMKWTDMANVMLYDACFIIALLISGLEGLYVNSSLSWEECEKVLSDLLVFDNQIPFSILGKLYCPLFGETDDPIETLALNLFGYEIPDRNLPSDDTKNASNLVELVHSYISMDLKDGQGSNHVLEIRGDKKPVQLDRCATMLRAAGVKINPADSDDVDRGFNFRIRFNSSSGLDIPILCINEMTRAWWLNLIAWEHHKMEQSGTRETIICKCTSAALFFNALICCESDVQLLKDKGIIMDFLDMSNKDLVTFFRSIIRGVTKIDPRYNIFSFDDLNKYYSHPIRRGTQIPLRFWHYLTGSPREVLRDLHNNLKRGYNYAVSLITILSLLSTIYAVLSYYHPKK